MENAGGYAHEDDDGGDECDTEEGNDDEGQDEDDAKTHGMQFEFLISTCFLPKTMAPR